MKFVIPLLFLIGWAAQANTTNQSQTARVLEAIAPQLKSRLPIQLSPTLTVENISTLNGELTYHYKSTASDAKSFNLKKFVEDRTTELTHKICSEASQKIFRDLKAIMNYEYSDKNDKLLTVIRIDAGKCN